MVAAVVGQDEICRSQAHVMIPHYVWIQVVHVNLKEENKNKQKNKFEETWEYIPFFFWVLFTYNWDGNLPNQGQNFTCDESTPGIPFHHEP